MSKKIVIVGGHGKVSLKLTKLITPKHSVSSIIRNPAQSDAIRAIGATPVILSLEDDSVSSFVDVFSGGIDVVVFSAGAGGKGGEDMTKKIDYGGALKVFDALDSVAGKKPRLILVSAIDVRDPEKIPEHYTEEDKTMSARVRGRIAAYMKWKYEADKDLVGRKGFGWFIIRPGGLNDEAGTGKASIGRTHLTPTISREDVALAIAELIEREDAVGLGMDIVGGSDDIREGVTRFIQKAETDFLG